MNYAEIVDALSSRRPFAFARYGDGELLCMAGTKGANKDKHKFFGDLGKRLQQTISAPRASITYALQQMVRKDRKLRPILHAHSKVEKWVDADVLHHESRHRDIKAFVEALIDRQANLVGPQRLAKLPFVHEHVLTPDRDCWLLHKATWLGVKERHKPGDVWVLCAGMSTAVLIYDLVGELEDATLIDAGSLFDPYVGKVSRVYHKQVLARLKR